MCSQVRSSLQLLKIFGFGGFLVVFLFFGGFFFKGYCQLTLLICLYVMFTLGKQIMKNFFPQCHVACWKSSVSEQYEERKGFPVFCFGLVFFSPSNSVILAAAAGQ